MNNVYFKSISINKAFNTATLVVTSAPMETKQATIAGIDVGTRNR